ncbi:MAG TPA: glycosyltransferase [Syntrophales bacterium]|nr:glycosyltransferase [Syntrophales bacterium]
MRREGSYYEKLFTARRLTIPDKEDVRKELKKRFPHVRSKPKGTLNILAVYHNYNWEDEALRPSLEKFGKVRHYDWAGQFNHQDKNWHKGAKSAMNRHLIGQVGLWVKEDATDVIFTYLSGELISPDAVRAMRSFGVPMVNLALNDKEHFTGKIRSGASMGSRDICRHFDICWTSTVDAVKKYCVEGAIPVYLPEGANPEFHRPYEMEKTIDVSFVGQCYGNRPLVIGKLKSLGLDVEAYGYGWPAGPLAAEDMVRIYSKSRINLGFGGIAGLSNTYCLKGRDFEIPMSGGLYLTEYHPELDRFYHCGSEIVTYRDFDDLVDKIRFLLSNPEKAEETREKGFKRARREHSWEMRFEQIFSLIGLL